MGAATPAKRAWVTLLTRQSYLLGAVMLAHSLHKQSSRYPLIILYTLTLPSDLISLLEREASLSNSILLPTKILHPKGEREELIAERFKDTWTKLRRENCAFYGYKHPEMTNPPPVPKDGEGKKTHTLLNSGLFVFEPSTQFPLVKEFIGRWMSVGWQYNALKTWRYWHPEMWRNEEVRNLHYIVDKPWSKRIGDDGKAGYLGKDGETHTWWWNEYEEWKKEREAAGIRELIPLMKPRPPN
ncbi:hypothetical protein B0J14DRAFT_664025 [Halenospora varia]|nr:hypothetical protein B0J14DRAFT_664025 [Halenospora varia]